MSAPPQARAGYVLIDLIAALAVAGLVLMLAQPELAQTTSPTSLHALLARIVATLKDARSAAVLQTRPVAAIFDARARTISAGNEVILLPRDLDVAVAAGAACRSSGRRVEILFRGDGTNCGAVLRFAKDTNIFRLRVNWLTGHVEIVKGD